MIYFFVFKYDLSIVDKPLFLNLIKRNCVHKYILCTQCTQCTHLYCSGQRGGGVYGGCCIIFLFFSNFHIQKGVQIIIGIKLKIRIMSSVSMLKHNIIYKRCLVIFNQSCLKRLKLSALYVLSYYV